MVTESYIVFWCTASKLAQVNEIVGRIGFKFDNFFILLKKLEKIATVVSDVKILLKLTQDVIRCGRITLLRTKRGALLTR